MTNPTAFAVSAIPAVRRISHDDFALMYRAMNGDAEAQALVPLEDVIDLVWAPTFAQFVDTNKALGRVQLYEA